LDQTEDALRVPALEQLASAPCFKLKGKGGDNLSPPFKNFAQGWVALAKFFQSVGRHLSRQPLQIKKYEVRVKKYEKQPTVEPT
jgi:hypothetical protein